ncbi:Cysteine-rich receptor-like protein kinase 19 [Bienertia sinuspersici]
MVPSFRQIIILFIFSTLTALFIKSASSQDLNSMSANYYIHHNCSSEDGQFDQGSEYQTNLYYLLSNLTSNSGSTKFYNFSIGENQNKVYGLYLCYYGIDTQLCQNCVQTAQNRILQDCTSNAEAIVWYSLCMLRYANRSIFATNDVSRYHLFKAGPAKYGQYNQKMSQTFISLFDVASSGCLSMASAVTLSILEVNLFLTPQVDCTPDLSKDDCRSCLRTALSRFQTQGHQIGILVQPSCRLVNVFFDLASLLPSGTHFFCLYLKCIQVWYNHKCFLRIVSGRVAFVLRSNEIQPYVTPIRVTSGITAIALTMVAIFIYCMKKRKIAKKPIGLEEIESMENLHIGLDTIKAATGNFSEASKLGQGGFGIVYMGTLGDGQAVAIKRLSNASGQGIREFKTEACLAAKLQHNNLVKVYGYCLEKNEMLLVYEFVPNKSLDRFLFDAKRGAYLKWDTRYKIIVGIARDGEMNPKIADFGLAKLFGGDQTQGNTSRIAGTFGYMAPEYVVSGHISIKSDIFSYGVILLEIVSGLRNRGSNLDEVNLVSYVSSILSEIQDLSLNYNSSIAHASVAVEFLALENNYSTIDVERCIHVGLLCTQDDPSKRPNMASVLIMLNTELRVELSSPTPPLGFPYEHETAVLSESLRIPVEDVITELSPR